MELFSKQLKILDIEEYIASGNDLNIIDPDTGLSFIEYQLSLLSSFYDHLLKDQIFNLLGNPLLKTEHLNIGDRLLELVYGFANGNLSTDQDIQKYKKRYNSIDFDDEKYKQKRDTFCLRFDLNCCNLENQNALHLGIYHSSGGARLYESLKHIHPDFHKAVKQVTTNGETLWHIFLSSYMHYFDNNVIQNLTYLNEHFPEGKYMKYNGFTPIEFIYFQQKTHTPKNTDDTRLQELNEYQDLIEKFMLKEKLDQSLINNKIKPFNKI